LGGIISFICPVCFIELGRIKVGIHQTLQCHVCSGIFLPYEQLQNQFKKDASIFSLLIQTTNLHRKCPSDRKKMDEKKLADGSNSILIDHCSHCQGVWFDPGEILQANKILRKNFGRSFYKKHASTIVQKAEYDAENYDQSPSMRDPMWWFSVLTYLPVEGYNKVFRTPMITWGFLLLCLLVYGFQVLYPELLFPKYALSSKSATNHPIELVTSIFMHGNIFHLLGNLYFLKTFGDNVEDRMGRLLFVMLFLFSGCFAGISFVLFDPSNLPMIGASGAVSGILGAYLIYFPKVKVFLIPNIFTRFRLIPFSIMIYIPIWFIYQVVQAFLSNEAIAWSAHIGGFIAGYAMALFSKVIFPDARLTYLRSDEATE
jgi:membrane associated rhomboid family serine protease